MTEIPAASTAPVVNDSRVPTGIRIASGVCWFVGVISIGGAFVVSTRPGGSGGMLLLNIVVGLAVCLAGYLTYQQRKAGAYILVLAWASPMIIGLARGTGARGGPLLLLLAILVLLANWKDLR
jgi:hypothetical protein